MSATVIFIIGVALLVLVPLYFLVARPMRHRRLGGRADHSERQELTGSEQYKHRKID
jgi:hypothetical protein